MEDEFIAVTKAGQRIEVNPDCLNAHLAAGWVLAPPAPTPSDAKPPKPSSLQPGK